MTYLVGRQYHVQVGSMNEASGSFFIQTLKNQCESFVPQVVIFNDFGMNYAGPPTDNISKYCCIRLSWTKTDYSSDRFGEAQVAPESSRESTSQWINEMDHTSDASTNF